MNFEIPSALTVYLAQLDAFIEQVVKPLQMSGDNMRFFDYRREWARTNFEAGGLPRAEWEELLQKVERLADRAGFWRFSAPKEYGGSNGSNLWMAVIRDHLARLGLGLHNDLQNEHSIVGNFPFIAMFENFGTIQQRQEFITGGFDRTRRLAFGLTEPDHGSDATFMETRAVRERRDGIEGWRIDGEKMWITGIHNATHCATFARTSGKDGDASGLSCFLVPSGIDGLSVERYMWTFNMPTDHGHLRFDNVWVPDSARLGSEGEGLAVAQSFVHQNRIRQAASSLGAASYCLEESVKYAGQRKPFGHPLAENQGIQFPLVEIATQIEMLRLLIYKTAWQMDKIDHKAIKDQLSDKIGMCNYWSNRLVCQAADLAMQIHGGIGYSREKPFEHIYRHHRRYRITEGSEQIQMRKVAAYLFGYADRSTQQKSCN